MYNSCMMYRSSRDEIHFAIDQLRQFEQLIASNKKQNQTGDTVNLRINPAMQDILEDSVSKVLSEIADLNMVIFYLRKNSRWQRDEIAVAIGKLRQFEKVIMSKQQQNQTGDAANLTISPVMQKILEHSISKVLGEIDKLRSCVTALENTTQLNNNPYLINLESL